LAHYALHQLHILPSELSKMTERERAFIFGSILVKVEQEKREKAKIKKK
jgi:hypothetical protein